jgi:hypothetical protein
MVKMTEMVALARDADAMTLFARASRMLFLLEALTHKVLDNIFHERKTSSRTGRTA